MRAPLLALALAAGCGGPPVAAMQYDATFTAGPFTIAPGADETWCTFVRGDNASEADITLLHTDHGAASHHLIVYAVDHAIDLAPRRCSQGGQPGWNQLLITQGASDDMQFPPGVGFHVRANQQYVIETHFINAGTAAVTTTGGFSVKYAPAGAALQQAAPILIGTTNIDIAAGQSASLTTTCTPPSDITLLRLAGHEHRFGTGVDFQLGQGGAALAPFYHSSSWDAPPTKVLDPPLALGTTDRFSVTCDWQNGDAEVYYPNEMCFTIGVYYPAKGAMFCIAAGGDPTCQCLTFYDPRAGGGGSAVKVLVSLASPLPNGIKGDPTSGRPIYCSLWHPEDWAGVFPKNTATPAYTTDVEGVALKDKNATAELDFVDVTPGDWNVFCYMDTMGGGLIPASGSPLAVGTPTITAVAGQTATASVTLDFAAP